MKRILKYLLVVGIVMFSTQVKAQWAVIDPSNLAQNIKSAIETTSTAKNMIKNLEESIKIYNQGKEYYDALKSVNNLVKDARKVQQTVVMISEITDIYVTDFQLMLQDGNFTPEELEAISEGYSIILNESSHSLNDLKKIISPSTLSLSDKERMDLIDNSYNDIKEYRSLMVYYSNKNKSVSYLRAKKKNDTERVIALYGNSDKYW